MTSQGAHRDHGSSGVLVRFRDDRSGATAIMFAMMALVMMLAIGGAIDIGRWLHARDQTLAAIDAALLAGGRALQTNSTDTATALAAAKSYYAQNVTTRLPVTDDTVKFTVSSDGMSMTANGSAYIKTPFLQLANISKLPLINTATADFSKSQIAVGGNGGENLEVAMMLDITGSMAGQKLQDMKDSANDLINIVVWKDQSKYTSRVAIVPFSEDIRLPTTTAMNAARGTGLASSKNVTTGSGFFQQTATYYLSDCVVERTGTQKYTDAVPKSGQYVMAHYTSNYTGNGSNKKGVCTVPAGSEVMPLTSDVTALQAKINGLSASGGTAGHLGTAWAWYTLSPNWKSLWASANQPAAYGSANLKKIAILMTDGEYNTQYNSSGVAVDSSMYPTCSSAANGCSTTQARTLCTNMKAAGITVYTVGFQLGGNQTAVDTLNQCATDPTKFYNATDGDQLKQAFRDIALHLSSLYLSK
jgi:Flp pilus assembly protein TadG